MTGLTSAVLGHDDVSAAIALRWNDLDADGRRRARAAYQVATVRDGRIVHLQDHDRAAHALRAVGLESDEPEPPHLGSTIVPSLAVRDVGRTVCFYVDRLGFAVTGRHPDVEPTWVELSRDGVRLHVVARDSGVEPGLAGVLYFHPDDVLALHRELAAHGVETEWGPEVMPYGMREFAIRDPDGYLLGFWEPA